MYLKITLFLLSINSCYTTKKVPSYKESSCMFFNVEKKEILLIGRELPFNGDSYDKIKKITITETDTSKYHRDIKTLKQIEDSSIFPINLKSYLREEYKDKCISVRIFTTNRFLEYSLIINPNDWLANKKIPFVLYYVAYPH
jgi:hypothetical protein